MIVWPAQIVTLHIGPEEMRIGHARLERIPRGAAHEFLRAIDAEGGTARSHRARNPHGAVAKTTADVENFRSRRIEITLQHLIAVACEALDEQVLETYE